MTAEDDRPGYEPFPLEPRPTSAWTGLIDQKLRRGLPTRVYRPMLVGYQGARRLARRNPGRGRMLPDFVIVGAAKAGTTSLYAWLSEHPYVRRPRRKEINYFNWQYYRGTDWYRHHFPLLIERQAFVAQHGQAFITGEASPSYMIHVQVPGRMARLLPSIKLLVCLRNPVDRAYSQFQMRRAAGEESCDSFLDALALEDPHFENGESPQGGVVQHASGRTYLLRGHYAEHLERWFAVFPRQQFHILTVDELARDPSGTLDEVLEFLELPPAVLGDLRPRFTQSYDPLSSETRSRVSAYFRSHNERLYELLERDFGWDK
jgi:Sulfotransferase domain